MIPNEAKKEESGKETTEPQCLVWSDNCSRREQERKGRRKIFEDISDLNFSRFRINDTFKKANQTQAE